MQLYVLRKGDDKLVFIRKGENFSDDDFSYTESGNDIIIDSYIGSDTDVKVVNKFRDIYMLVRPSKSYKVNVEDYENTLKGTVLTLTKYIGSGGDVDTPELEEES